ncbi:MAG TPA: hypothetical protein VIX86_19900 [Streptosporangiaceae bacterium]
MFGGAAVSIVTYFGNREKVRAQTSKLKAEEERIRVETETLRAKNVRADSQQGIGPADSRQGRIPGWFISGTWPEDYRMARDRTLAHSGNASARIEAKLGARGFGTLMQQVSSVTMRGKRIRMSAFVKTEDTAWAALWMRVDDHESTLAFDNMSDRPIKGTTDWRKYEIVLDVDAMSKVLAFGILLAERGRVWVDDFNFEPVSDDVAVTDTAGRHPMQPGPSNLSFDE